MFKKWVIPFIPNPWKLDGNENEFAQVSTVPILSAAAVVVAAAWRIVVIVCCVRRVISFWSGLPHFIKAGSERQSGVFVRGDKFQTTSSLLPILHSLLSFEIVQLFPNFAGRITADETNLFFRKLVWIADKFQWMRGKFRQIFLRTFVPPPRPYQTFYSLLPNWRQVQLCVNDLGRRWKLDNLKSSQVCRATSRGN